MAPAANGDTVKIHYTGTLDDGYKFDSSYDHLEPLEFTIGRGEMIRGFEQAVVGMEPGETKIVRIASNQAYGRHNPEKVIQVSRSKMPEGLIDYSRIVLESLRRYSLLADHHHHIPHMYHFLR